MPLPSDCGLGEQYLRVAEVTELSFGTAEDRDHCTEVSKSSILLTVSTEGDGMSENSELRRKKAPRNEKQWQEARQIVLDRDGHKCVISDGTCEGGLDVHHVIPRAQGGPDHPSNLITLCDKHHAARHPTLQVSLARRAIESMGLRLAKLLSRPGELPDDLTHLSAALRALGLDRFREGQLEVILAVLKGKSVLVVWPTGAGKGICFQVPALLASGTSFVVEPTKALMIDQVTRLQDGSIVPATFINSDLSKAEKALRYKALEQGLWKLFYISPERLDRTRVRDPLEVERLMHVRPPYLVIDEVHHIPDWGESFRPSYSKLRRVRHQLGDPPVLCFTATAGSRTESEVLRSLAIPDAHVFRRNVDRPNIALLRAFVPSAPQRYRIMARLIRHCSGKALIFVPTVKIGEKLQQGLARFGLDVPFFYGRLDKLKRANIQSRFCDKLEPWLDRVICTSAFAEGIDVPNIRLVIHEGQPASPEEYWQEIGRAGRDREAATAVLFKRDDDVRIQQFMIEKQPVQGSLFPEQENDARRRRRLKAIGALDRMIKNKHRCFRRQLLEYLGVVDRQPKRSFGMRIVEWLFATRNSQAKAKFCCDFCNPEETREFFLGERAASRANPTLDT